MDFFFFGSSSGSFLKINSEFELHLCLIISASFKIDNSNLKKAIFTVILADITMSLDNVLGVAGAAKDHYTLLAFGLGLSILLMAFAANYTAKLIKKYSWISWVGLIAILTVAVQLIYEDLQILL